MDRKDHYNWLANPEYAAAAKDAEEQAIELLEESVRRRAIRAKKPSDLLSIFLLKAARPERYRDNVQVQHTGEFRLIIERLSSARQRLKGDT